MIAAPESTAGLVPNPTEVCAHISRLNRELKIARQLLRVAMQVHGRPLTDKKPPFPKPEGAARVA